MKPPKQFATWPEHCALSRYWHSPGYESGNGVILSYKYGHLPAVTHAWGLHYYRDGKFLGAAWGTREQLYIEYITFCLTGDVPDRVV